MYYVFYFLHQELRDMTLFRELFNKTNQNYRISIAAPFSPIEAVESSDHDLEQITERLQKFVAEEMPLGAREFRLR
jgi:putative hemolysin